MAIVDSIALVVFPFKSRAVTTLYVLRVNVRNGCFYPSNQGQLQPEANFTESDSELFLSFKSRAVTTNYLYTNNLIVLFLPFKSRAITTHKQFRK